MNPEELRKMTFDDLQTEALEVRQSAKATRKDWKDCPPSEALNSNFQSRIDDLEIVISVFKERLDNAETSSLSERDICVEIGDCYGVQGGTYRDWEKFLPASKAYEEGRKFEKRVEELGGSPNSYCLVQRLVNLILADPDAYSERAPINDVDVRTELEQAQGIIRGQMEVERKGDPWAQADLALVSQLLDDDDDAINEWDKFDDLEPKKFVYEATSAVVLPMLEKLTSHLSEEQNEAWKDVKERLNP